MLLSFLQDLILSLLSFPLLSSSSSSRFPNTQFIAPQLRVEKCFRNDFGCSPPIKVTNPQSGKTLQPISPSLPWVWSSSMDRISKRMQHLERWSEKQKQQQRFYYSFWAIVQSTMALTAAIKGRIHDRSSIWVDISVRPG